jgi:drug/metabolite transporter (DMT)-like permease
MAIFLRKGRGFRSPDNIKHGLIAGILLFAGYFTQTVGLQYTSAAASGIITGANVVFLPIISIMYLKSRVSTADTIASIMALSGLIVMSLGALGSIGTLIGDALTLFCAIAYAVQIAYVSKHSKNLDSYAFTFYQIAAVTILSAVTIPVMPGTMMTLNNYVIFGIIFSAVFASVFAFYISTVGLIYVEPTTVGIIFVAEPVFAAISAVIIGHEVLSVSVIIGGVIMVMAMFLTSIDKYIQARSVRTT